MNNNKIKQSCYLTHAPEHCSLLVHQLFGWVQLHDPSLGQNHHSVVVEDGVQTVGNSDDCAKKNMIAFIVKHIYFQKLIIIIYKYPKFLKDDLLFFDFKLWVLSVYLDLLGPNSKCPPIILSTEGVILRMYINLSFNVLSL